MRYFLSTYCFTETEDLYLTDDQRKYDVCTVQKQSV